MKSMRVKLLSSIMALQLASSFILLAATCERITRADGGHLACTDNGCKGRGGQHPTCGAAGGCFGNPCECKTDPTDNSKCYCNQPHL